jgi:UDP-N-acetylmuramoyl-tripeptide--D-alanyl-D-alanine ligase
VIRALSLGEIAQALGVMLPAGMSDRTVEGVSTDSRTVAPGDLFVALRGERFDAHDHVGEAQSRGAAALVCSRPVSASVPVLLVSDTEHALGAIAALHRSLFAGTVVALTGSAGKTTTKEMIAAILATAGPVLATRDNLNNEIGVPLTLFRLERKHRYAVIEMGAGKPGDIAYLAGIAKPQLALLTNALPAHLERLGSLGEVARTKGAIYEALPADGTAILNADDDFADYWTALAAPRRVLRFSASGKSDADIRALDVRLTEGCARFRLELPGDAADVRLSLPGVQQVANTLAAAAVGHALGLRADAIASALADLQAPAGRMQRCTGPGGAQILDDTYNANPGSVRAAIDTLSGFRGLRVLALGNMAELGPQAAELHMAMGRYAQERGIDRLLTIGPHAGDVAEGFGSGAEIHASRDELARSLGACDAPGNVILVKGSRSAGMDAVVAALTRTHPGDARTGTH